MKAADDCQHSDHDQYTLVIEPRHAERRYWKDLWDYRELLLLLSRRDFSARYKQSILGVGWAFLKPLLEIITFTVLLGRVAKLPSEPGVPYAMLIFSGTLIWGFCAQCLAGVSGSLLTNAGLIGKVYFPRLIIPLSATAVALADFAIALLLFAGFLFWFQIVPPIQCLMLPLFLLLGGVVALGPGLILASLTLYYRDVAHAVPRLTALCMYLAPVVYTSSLVPERWRLLYNINPTVGVVDGFRWAVLGTPEFPAQALLFSCLWAAVMLLAGVMVFRRMERTFVDVM